MNMFKLILLAVVMVWGQNSMAQIKVLPKERIDSIANPPLAPNAGNVIFEQDMIIAEFASGDTAPRTFEYEFINKGIRPLVISRLVSTCSCAKAEYDKRVIKPGERGVIRLIYSPEGRIGKNIRRVFVYTDDNTQPSAILRLEVTHSH